MHKRISIAIVFVFVYSLIVWRVLFVGAADRSSVFGDGYSDINTMSSAAFFLDSGFVKTKLLPVHEYPQQMPALAYTHYPALPNILAGIYAHIFNTANEQILRIVPVLLSVFFFFFIFYVLKYITKKDKEAFWAACLMVLSNYFIGWADNLHKHLYEELINWAYFLLLFIHHENDRKKNGTLLALFLLMLIGVNISYEQPVFLGIATVGFAYVYQRKIFTKETIGVFLSLVVGFGLHFYQNYLYFNSLQATVEDMKNAFVYRTTGKEMAGFTSTFHFNFWHNLPEIPFSWFNRMERFYIIPGWGLLIMGFWSCRNSYKADILKFKLILVAFLSAMAWSFVMPQHDYIHTFTNRHFAVFYALSLVYVLPAYIGKLKTDFAANTLYPKVLHVVLLAYCCTMFVSQQVWDTYLKHGFLFGMLQP